MIRTRKLEFSDVYPAINCTLRKAYTTKFNTFKGTALLSSSSTGTLATGIFFSRQKTRLLLQGHNSTWYHQKNSCFDHLCLIGIRSAMHKKAIDHNKKISEIEAKKSTAITNIFRCAIIDLQLGAAGRHLGTLVSFLAQC